MGKIKLGQNSTLTTAAKSQQLKNKNIRDITHILLHKN